MKKANPKKAILIVASFLFLCLLAPFQYDDIKLGAYLYPVIATGLIFIVYRYVPKTTKARRPVIIISVILYSLYMLSFLMDLGYCGWSETRKLYVNKHNRSVSIVGMRHGCLTAIDEPEWFKVRSITHHLTWVTSFHEDSIDTATWEKINEVPKKR